MDFVAPIVGAALNFVGAREANEMNIALADKQMAFQRGTAERAMEFGGSQAEKQMAFQERMSNTAYQRTIADMKAAGINPIMAFQQGGASTPSGSSAQGVSAQGTKADYRNQYAAAVSSAMQIMQMGAQVDQTRALTQLMRADLPEKERTGEVYTGTKGKVLKTGQEWTKLIGNVFGAAGKATPWMKYIRPGM